MAGLLRGTGLSVPQRHQSSGVASHGADRQNQSRTNYHKGAVGGGGRNNSVKEIHEDSGSEMRMSGGGADSHGNSGPTGSSRVYPHGHSREMSIVHHVDWNPMELVASTYGICGVDAHEARSIHGRGRHE
jgi:hypothetical protein